VQQLLKYLQNIELVYQKKVNRKNDELVKYFENISTTTAPIFIIQDKTTQFSELSTSSNILAILHNSLQVL
jgi:hypothetical protein